MQRTQVLIAGGGPCGRMLARALRRLAGHRGRWQRAAARPARRHVPRGLDLALVTRPEQSLRDLYEAPLVLVRPDQVVAWRGGAAPADAAASWDRLPGG